MNVRLHIERVILDGAPLGSRDLARFRAGLQAELGRLLAQIGVPPGWCGGGRFPSTPADPVALEPETAPARWGEEIARALYGGFRR